MDLFLAGVFAGLALAIPLGPMAILLITTTIKQGRVVGFFGALAMASVDFFYAAAVFAFGNLVVNSLSDWLLPMRLAGSAILILISIQIFLQARKSKGISVQPDSVSTATKLSTFAKFFGLTILNPATAFYFVGITPSVTSLETSSGAIFGFFVFALGVFVGSIVWQFSLVVAATITKNFSDHKFQRRLQYIGAALILLLSVWLLLK